MFYFYLFALIVGGVLLAAAALLGGDHDAEAGDLSHGDLDHGVESHGKHIGEVPADVGGLLWILRSMRFWTFFLAFFGLTGLTLGGLGLVDSRAIVGLLAVGMGLVCGYGAAKIIHALTVSDTANSVNASEYIGKTARVLVAMNASQTGKVRVDAKGTTVDLLAKGQLGAAFNVNDHVYIVEIHGTTAYVARELKTSGLSKT